MGFLVLLNTKEKNNSVIKTKLLNTQYNKFLINKKFKNKQKSKLIIYFFVLQN